MATLLPNGKQQFIDGNGDPLAAGTVAFYVPGTLTPKDTWQDSGQTILNTNPVTLDASGEAIIYGSGVYRQIVKDSSGNTIWDEITADTAVGGIAFGGISTGTENAQVVAASSFTQQDGQVIDFIAGLTNTGALTIAPGGGAGIPVLADTASGPTPMTGGEVVAGNAYSLIYDAARGAFHAQATAQAVPTTFADSAFRIFNLSDTTKKIAFDASGITTGTTRTQTVPDASGVTMLTGAGQTTIASSSTVNLGASPTIDVIISGTTGITSFGTAAAGTRRKGYFSGALVLTYNATSMILPGSTNIGTTAGDSFEAVSLGSGNWKVLWYQRQAGALGVGQLWQNVTRVVGTVYQNTTSLPIQIAVTMTANNSIWRLQVSADNSTYFTVGEGLNNNAFDVISSASAILPSGYYYKVVTVAGSPTIAFWTELR